MSRPAEEHEKISNAMSEPGRRTDRCGGGFSHATRTGSGSIRYSTQFSKTSFTIVDSPKNVQSSRDQINSPKLNGSASYQST